MTKPLHEIAPACIEGTPFADAECIKMLHDRILIQRDAAQDRIGSILLPETSQERPVTGLVKAVGPKVSEVKVGDRIYYSARGRKEITWGGVYHQIIQEADVFGVEG
jgi:co-chaperonin GroES (HSP10)